MFVILSPLTATASSPFCRSPGTNKSINKVYGIHFGMFNGSSRIFSVWIPASGRPRVRVARSSVVLNLTRMSLALTYIHLSSTRRVALGPLNQVSVTGTRGSLMIGVGPKTGQGFTSEVGMDPDPWHSKGLDSVFTRGFADLSGSF